MVDARWWARLLVLGVVSGVVAARLLPAEGAAPVAVSGQALRPVGDVPTTAFRHPGPGTALIATATGATVSSYEAPGVPGRVEPAYTFPNPWFVDESLVDDDPTDDDRGPAVPLVFLVAARRGDGWLQVWLPIRPNGSTGWIRDSEVTVTATGYRVVVTLGDRRLTVYDGDRVLLTEPVAIGAPATPTPTGRYFLRALLRAPVPDTVYGPYAYDLSGHSPTLTTFEVPMPRSGSTATTTPRCSGPT